MISKKQFEDFMFMTPNEHDHEVYSKIHNKSLDDLTDEEFAVLCKMEGGLDQTSLSAAQKTALYRKHVEV
jgi:hypothetical protein